MKRYSSKEIRKIWQNFWKSKDHEILESKSLIPVNDSSLLWINSGVATLKDYFSGKKLPANPKMASIQKSIRTNDVDNVGITARHNTLFEMLGNFSIGDYFKNQALDYAHEFLFDVLKFSPNKIYITYFGEDKETYNKWLNLGIHKNHLIKGTQKTNFWEVGQGPCGPNTEIFYDRGIKYDKHNQGLKLLEQDLENDRYVEIWNIVFSQFNKDEKDNYIKLKQKNIDTGAGLERLTLIFQEAPTIFDTDLFLPIINKIEEFTNKKYVIQNYFLQNKSQTKINKHFQIIADHIRAVVEAIEDGAEPSNIQRGYIVRMLLRRAYRSGLQLGIKLQAFLFQLVEIVAKILDVYFVDVLKVQAIIKKEEIAFSKTIKHGEKLLKDSLHGKNQLEFNVAFKLFETYGFPIELTKELLAEKGIKLDVSKFHEYKNKHADISRSNKATRGMKSQIQIIQEVKSYVSEFIGYSNLESESQIIFQGKENDKVYVLLNKTPFYATSGGQIHDYGTINNLQVEDVFKDKYGNHWHIVSDFINSKIVHAVVNSKIRLQKARNHSGTHLLGHALRRVLGQNVVQLGSENNENRLRFDFPYKQKPTKEEIDKIEREVNKYIQQNIEREYIIDTFKNGIKIGALALEGETDNDLNKISRIVKFGDSIEFCGGTHVQNSSFLQKFKIIKLESKGSGTYRVEAITSFVEINNYEKKVKTKLIFLVQEVINKVQNFDQNYQPNLSDTIHGLQIQLEQVKEYFKKNVKKRKDVIIDFEIEFRTYKNQKTFIKLDVNPIHVKSLAISLQKKYPDALFIIGKISSSDTLLAISSKKYNAKKNFQELAMKYNGKGGGNENFAMGKIEKIKNI